MSHQRLGFRHPVVNFGNTEQKKFHGEDYSFSDIKDSIDLNTGLWLSSITKKFSSYSLAVLMRDRASAL